MTRNCEILEIGVLFEEKKAASTIPVAEVLFSENGKPLQMYFDVLEGLKWIGGVPPSTPIPIPPVYEVSLSYRTVRFTS